MIIKNNKKRILYVLISIILTFNGKAQSPLVVEKAPIDKGVEATRFTQTLQQMKTQIMEAKKSYEQFQSYKGIYEKVSKGIKKYKELKENLELLNEINERTDKIINRLKNTNYNIDKNIINQVDDDIQSIFNYTDGLYNDINRLLGIFNNGDILKMNEGERYIVADKINKNLVDKIKAVNALNYKLILHTKKLKTIEMLEQQTESDYNKIENNLAKTKTNIDSLKINTKRLNSELLNLLYVSIGICFLIGIYGVYYKIMLENEIPFKTVIIFSSTFLVLIFLVFLIKWLIDNNQDKFFSEYIN